MSNVFVFDPVLFKQIYPQFQTLSDELLTYFFKKSKQYIDNSESSCFSLDEREIWFYLLIAHMAELQTRINDGNSSLVGSITSASEGSVSIGVNALQSTSATGAWLNQTPYGAEFWVSYAKYRHGVYIMENLAMPVDRFRYPQ